MTSWMTWRWVNYQDILILVWTNPLNWTTSNYKWNYVQLVTWEAASSILEESLLDVDCSFTWGISRKLIRADLSFSRDPAWRCFRLVLLSVLMARSLPRKLNLTRQLDRMQSTTELFWHFSLFLITYMCSENSPLLVLEQLIPRKVSWQLWMRGVG